MEQKKCLIPLCPKPIEKHTSSRGLCGRCYAEARRMVRLKLTNWHELEQLKLADPPKRKMGEKATIFMKTLIERREEAKKIAEEATSTDVV